MKKLGLLILGLYTALFACNFTWANSEYEYTNLDITANILEDGTMNVKEDFTANFFINKHGIIRSIPLNYSVGGNNFHINISNIHVEGKKFTTSTSNGEVSIKIGDANKTITGEQEYPISYTTYGLIRNFSGMGYAELYWNLVGYNFDTNINKVYATINLPKPYTGFLTDNFLITTDGTSKTVEEFKGTVDWSQGDKIIITYDEGLSSYNGITLSVAFPNDYFEFNHKKQAKLIGHIKTSSFKIDRDAIGAALLPFAMIALFIFAFTKSGKNFKNKIDRKFGKLKGDFADKFPVIVQYEPPKGLNSAEAGLLLHRRAEAKDMLSLIYKRAAEGLINLSVEEEEGLLFQTAMQYVTITKNNDIDASVPKYERDFFNALVRDEENKIGKNSNLYDKLGLSSLEKYGEMKGWFTASNKIEKFILISVLGIFLIAPILGMISPMLALYSFIGFFFLIIATLGGARLKETEEGAKLISHILGYREFLAACDEDKLRTFLKQDPLYLDKILPYAVVFGLDTELIKKVEPIMKEMNIKSSWYEGDIDSMCIINDTISSVVSHSESGSSYSSSDGRDSGSSFDSGGSDFDSGGGGGGGGGSSW